MNNSKYPNLTSPITPLWTFNNNMKRNYLLLLLLVAIGVRAADYVHYSEWITASEMKRTPHSYNLNFSAWAPNWSYQTGVELDGMLDVYTTYGDEKLGNYLKEYPAKMIDAKGNITGYKYDDFNLDNVRPGHFLMRYYQLFPAKKDSLALDLLMSQLENQPRTDEGVWWHKAIYARQVWLDGIFMGLPFYTLAAPFLAPGYERDYYDDAVDQITKTDQRTYDAATRLWKHAWDETHEMFWANPTTGLSQHTWARALGWFTMAMVEILDALPETYEPRQQVIDLFQRAMTSVVEYQDAASGVWFDVLDVDDPRNYLEATASSMFAYCLLKGHRMGYLDDSFLEAGIRARASDPSSGLRWRWNVLASPFRIWTRIQPSLLPSSAAQQTGPAMTCWVARLAEAPEVSSSKTAGKVILLFGDDFLKYAIFSSTSIELLAFVCKCTVF